MLLFLLLPMSLFLNFFACDANLPVDERTSFTFVEGYEFPYVFKSPDTSFVLSEELNEISGLSQCGVDSLLVCVQDEAGILYFISKRSGAIVREVEFYKKGDFEGVEVVGNTIFAIKSKGDVFEIKDWEKPQQQLTVYDTRLNKLANVEGLGYDSSSGKLLLACKGKMEKDSSFSRAVYGFDLATKKLDSLPVFMVDLNLLHSYIDGDLPVKYLEKISEKFDPKKGFIFGPSGIAIHPVSKNVYLLSSVGKMLIVLSPTGKIIHIEKFNKKIHLQPEGICFDRDGTLWISNEAKKAKPLLVRFSMN